VIGEVFNLIILRPMLNALLLLYWGLHGIVPGAAFALAIAILTVVLRLITQPFMAKQIQSSRKMAELQPQLKELEKKYGKDKERLAQEQMKLYREHGINPVGGCLPMLLQFPIWIGLYQSIMLLLGNTPTQLLALSKHVYSFGIFAGLSSLFPLASRFLWLDLGRPDPFYIIPLLVAATQFVQQKMMTPAPSGSNDASAQMGQSMMMMMPLMFGFITINLASGLGVYFIISSLIGIVIQYFTTGWGGLLPQQATAGAAKSGESAGALGAVKRLLAPASRDGEAGAPAASSGDATMQPAASDAKGGERGQAKAAAGPGAHEAASMQKGTKRGSRKKKR
jgi:YidC/Oxa1 family membrane protein insertase